MSNRLARTIDVSFNVVASSPASTSLGTILCIGEDAEFPQYDETTKPNGFKDAERSRIYGSLAEMVADGFLTTSVIHKLASTVFVQKAVTQIIIARKKTSDATYLEALNDIIDKEDNWFGLLSTTITKADILVIAGFAENNNKFYSAGTVDAACLDENDATDIMSSLKTLSYKLTSVSYHSDITNNRIDAGILAKVLGSEAGSSIAKFQTITGCAIDDIGTNYENIIEGKNGNYYTQIAEKGCYSDGFMADGGRMDIVRDKQWLTQETQLRLFDLLKSYSDRNEKIEYSNRGLQIITTSVLIPLFTEALTKQIIRFATKEEIATQMGIATSALDYYYESYGFALYVPDVATIDPSFKAARKITGFKFSANIAGAIESMSILGNLFI